MSFIHPNTNRFKHLCKQVLALWCLCVFSSALMASLPGVEAEEGFIVLCTADGLKKIPLDSIDSASFDGDSASESNSLELVAMHGSQHCTLCNAGSLSSSDMAQAIIPVESFDFSALLVPVSFLRIDQPKPNTPYSPSPQQRAPPRSVI